jgi:hypothetical protein
MLMDAALPPTAALAGLARQLADDAKHFSRVPAEAVLNAWCATVAEFADRSSSPRAALDAVLPESCGLSPAGLDAALATILAGVERLPAEAIFTAASKTKGDSGLVVVVLAANIPGLVVQPLLPALALARPVLIKSSMREPLFAPTFVAALIRREPRLAPHLAAVAWPGGDHELEREVLATATRVLAYGGGEAIEDLTTRVGEKLVAFGPRLSFAAISKDIDLDVVAPGLARDIALFDQRGCLSVQAIYTDGDGETLARALAVALDELAERWPPGTIEPSAAAAVQQIRGEAEMRGLLHLGQEPGRGTVIVDPDPRLRPSPGLRLVRIYPMADLDELPALLKPWQGRLQGAALAGRAQQLAPRLAQLGVTRLADPGHLQDADATWKNGGLAPLAAFGVASFAGSVPPTRSAC